MPILRTRLSWSPRAVGVAALAVTLLVPALARAQYSAPELNTGAIGERYHFEFDGTLWNPDPAGQIASEQFGIVGTKIDFVNDLGFKPTRFGDMRIVLRASKKSKFRIQYTPVDYTSDTTLNRQIVFNGQNFNVNLPVHADFGWTVWRFGYEYDFTYRSRGYVGMLLEGRYTEMTATLASPIEQLNQYTIDKAPLPAVGVVGRAYILPAVAINFEVSGFKLPNVSAKYQANYYDWDVHGTVNLTNYVGVQVGWRRMSTYMQINQDYGNLLFQGLWFGAAVRY